MAVLLQASTEDQYQEEFFEICARLFEKQNYFKGSIIWKQDEIANELLILESGELILLIDTEDDKHQVIETVLPGTMVGELEFFSQKSRLFTLKSEQNSVVWTLSQTQFERKFQENPKAMRQFISLALSYDITRFCINIRKITL